MWEAASDDFTVGAVQKLLVIAIREKNKTWINSLYFYKDFKPNNNK